MEDTTIEDTLKTVETLYAQKEFQSALDLLMANKKSISPGLWNYNVGTVYAGLNEWPLARYHLLMAEREGFISKESGINLDLVEEKLEISRLEKPFGWSDYLVKGGLFVSEGILSSLALLILVVGLFNLRKSKTFKSLGLTVSAVLFVLGINWWIQSWHKMIVLTPQGIHEGPSGIFAAREEIPAGVLIITTQEEEWAKIIYPMRFQGWIKNSGLKELK